ncbi:hypothetical protein [Bradyrhizobium sp. URHC0002]
MSWMLGQSREPEQELSRITQAIRLHQGWDMKYVTGFFAAILPILTPPRLKRPAGSRWRAFNLSAIKCTEEKSMGPSWL